MYLIGFICLVLFVVTTEQIDKAKEVIKKLKFEFQSEDFENPGNVKYNNAHCTSSNMHFIVHILQTLHIME